MRDPLKAKYVLMDYDGTLADSNGLFIEPCIEWIKEYGLEPTPEYREYIKAAPGPAAIADYVYNSTGVKIETDIFFKILRTVSEKFYAEEVQPKPNAIEFVRKLKSSGVRMCLFSATDEDMLHNGVKRFGIEDCFEEIITSKWTGGVTKTKPDMYLAALKYFGSPDPGEVAIYDDSIQAIRIGRELGMITVGVYDEFTKSLESKIRELCDVYIYNFSELTQF